MLNSIRTNDSQPSVFMNAGNDTSWLTEFHTAIQGHLNAYENNHFQLCEIRYEDNKISHHKLKDLIESLLAPYPDLLTQFRKLFSTILPQLLESAYNRNDQSAHKSVKFSSHDNNISLIDKTEPSIFRLFMYKNPDYEGIRDFIELYPELAHERNELGQPPLHVACIKGYPFVIINALVDAYPDALTVKDNAGRLPLHHYVTVHCASSWTDSVTSPSEEYRRDKKIADLSVDVINLLGAKHLIMQTDDFGVSPLACLALECHFMNPSNKLNMEKANEILDTMINFDPPFSINLFKTIRRFPNKFVKRAANNQYIKEKLNIAASSSFLFLASIILDLVIRLSIINAYTNIPSLRKRYKGEKRDDSYNFAMLYIGITYLIGKLFIRLLSFKEVGNTMDWTKSGWNWLQLLEISLLLSSAIGLHTAPKRDHSVSTTFAAGIQWLTLLIVLRPASRHFVRFWSGILNVLRVLFPFLITMSIFMLGFCFMLHFSYKYGDCKHEEECEVTVPQILYRILQESINGEFSHEIKDLDFITAVTLLYGILLILLLLNILIAIVIEAYGETNGDKTFWFERLIYVSEIEMVLPCRSFKNGWQFQAASRRYLESSWERFLLFLFQPKRFRLHEAEKRGYSLERTSCRKIVDGTYRFLGLIVGLPLWLLVGFLTLGLLLPIQVKSYLLDGDIEKKEEEDTSLKDDLESLKESMLRQMKQIKHLEKRQNKKLMTLQTELEINRSKEEETLNKLNLLIDSLKKDK